MLLSPIGMFLGECSKTICSIVWERVAQQIGALILADCVIPAQRESDFYKYTCEIMNDKKFIEYTLLHGVS